MTTIQVNGKDKLLEVSDVKTNVEGFHFHERIVRLPEHFVADDLRDPKVWRHIQIGPRSNRLLKFDRLFILSFDESWYAEAVVNFVDAESAGLTILKVGTFRPLDKTLYADNTYKVVWDGAGYAVHRVSDSVMMGNQSHSTEKLAIAALRALYPVQVGG